MKLALITRSLAYGGAPRQLVTLAKGLAERGHAIGVGVFYSGGALETELTAAGIPVRSLNKRHRWDVVRFMAAAFRFWRKEQPEMVLSYLIAPDLLAAFMRPFFPRTRVVWGIRASQIDMSRDFEPGLESSGSARWTRPTCSPDSKSWLTLRSQTVTASSDFR